ncbi:hypothetical protein [Nonomuraea sp. NPDC005650]|uniref:hypothetical protein n=1 Tax=Nonomuraea sp. NPDC005650 TaxID=3157045 RepID=UPI0033B54FDA
MSARVTGDAPAQAVYTAWCMTTTWLQVCWVAPAPAARTYVRGTVAPMVHTRARGTAAPAARTYAQGTAVGAPADCPADGGVAA